MLNFIGLGSAFNTELGNTSAFIKKGKSLILIDCGGTVFHKLQSYNLLDDVENAYIIITHTHPDHVGSLGEVIFYFYYILNKKVNIFFRDEKWIKNFFTYIGVEEEMYNLYSSKNIHINDIELGDFSVEFIPVSHYSAMPCYGFIMKINNEAFYYSGDTNALDEKIINKLKDSEIKRIYQDTCGLDYEGNIHLSLNKLSRLIPHDIREKVYCIHIDNHINEKNLKEYGFKTPKLYTCI